MSEFTMASVPALNPMFRLQFENAQQCFVLLYPEGMVKLNGSAGEIMQQVDGTRSVEEITQALTDKFPDAGDIGSDIQAFLATAHDKKWIAYAS